MNQEHNRHIDFDEVARYLAKEMSTEERHAFEQELNTSPALKAEFDQIASLWSEAADTSAFATDTAWNQLDARIQETARQAPEATGKTTAKYSFKGILRIAASLLILAVAGWYATTLFNTAEPLRIAALNEPLSQKLPDNSMVQLNTGAILEYDESFGTEQRLVQLKGEAFFQVTHNPDKPFIVQTALGNVQVLGTEFNVKHTQENEFEITVQSGKVQVTLPDGSAKRILKKGESAVLDIVKGTFDVSYHTANLYWLTKSIKFNNIDFETVFKILSKTFRVEFKVQNTQINNCKLKTTLQKNQSLKDFLEVIEANEEGESDIEFIQKEGSVYEVRGKGC